MGDVSGELGTGEYIWGGGVSADMKKCEKMFLK